MHAPRHAVAGLLVVGTTMVDAYNTVGGPVVKMSGEFCKAKLSDHSHLFHRMWSSDGWSTTTDDGLSYQAEQTLPKKCWDAESGSGEAFFSRVSKFEKCGTTDWITMDDSDNSRISRGERDMLLKWDSPNPMESTQLNKGLLGFDDDILRHCIVAAKKVYSQRNATLTQKERDAFERQIANEDPRVMCPLGGYQMLHVEPWSMCRNFEWQVCAASGTLRYEQQPLSALYFATPPGSLDPSGANGGNALGHCDGCVPEITVPGSSKWTPSGLDSGVYAYANVDIYFLEVCLLHSICENGDDLFKLSPKDQFRCQFSQAKFAELKNNLLQPTTPRPESDAFCVRSFDYKQDPITGYAYAQTDGLAQPVYRKPGLINKVFDNDSNFTGMSGGACTCPDGAQYMVGDNHDNCASLACEGGKAGACFKKPGPWSGRRVKCGLLEDGVGVSGIPPVPALPPVESTSLFSAFPSWRGKPSWDDFKYECQGGGDFAGQQSWLSSVQSKPPDMEMTNYLKSVYGAGAMFLEKTKMGGFSYFWNYVPGRTSFKATWSTARCAILGLFPQNLLHAPADDAQHNPDLISQAMLERCNRKECLNGQECWGVPLRPLTPQEEDLEEKRGVYGMQPHSTRQYVKFGSSGMRTCISRSLEAFSNFSSGVTFSAGVGGAELPDGLAAVPNSGQALVAKRSEGGTGFPPLKYKFPGVLVARPEFVTPADFFDQIDRSKGVKSHTWVEVMRISRIDDKMEWMHQEADRSTIGQVWFWLSPGSGVWWNTGKTIVVNTSVAMANDGFQLSPTACTSPNTLNSWWETRDVDFKWATCKSARARGYDSMQLTNSFCGFSWEMVDCRGAERKDAHETWTAACPPPHIQLKRGLPTPRAAPALVDVRGPSSSCQCSADHSHINCAANMEPLPMTQTVTAQAVAPDANKHQPHPLVISLLDIGREHETWEQHKWETELQSQINELNVEKLDMEAVAAHVALEQSLGNHDKVERAAVKLVGRTRLAALESEVARIEAKNRLSGKDPSIAQVSLQPAPLKV